MVQRPTLLSHWTCGERTVKYRVEIWEAVRGQQPCLLHTLIFSNRDEALTRARATTLANTLPLTPDWYSFSQGPYPEPESPSQ